MRFKKYYEDQSSQERGLFIDMPAEETIGNSPKGRPFSKYLGTGSGARQGEGGATTGNSGMGFMKKFMLKKMKKMKKV